MSTYSTIDSGTIHFFDQPPHSDYSKVIYLGMTTPQPFNVKIDKLTHSIEHWSSGISFETEVLELKPADIPRLKKADWLFDWKKK